MKHRILIVENLQDDYEHMSSVLESVEGWSCTHATGISDGHILSRNLGPSCIILDDHFPNRVYHGERPEASQFLLSSADLDLPIIIVTAYHDATFPQVSPLKPFLEISKPDSFGPTVENLVALREFDRQLVQAVRAAVYCRELIMKGSPPSPVQSSFAWRPFVVPAVTFVIGAVTADVLVRFIKWALARFVGTNP